MSFCGLSNPGRLRENNEDCYHIPRNGDALKNLFIVADGMGGAKAGEVASALAISAAYTLFEAEYSTHCDISLLVRRAINEANKVVYNAALADKRFSNMGTTMTLALIESEYLYIGNVGDSRAYLLSNGKLKQLTNDHSLVQELIDSGIISKSEAYNHPERNVITRSLGNERFVRVDVFTAIWQKGDILLLTTDGLTGMVNEESIQEILLQKIVCRQKVEKLIAAANSAGGRDNITVVCVENDGGCING